MLIICLFITSAGFFSTANAENDNLSVSSVESSETIKIGNTKTNNYNIQDSNFLPTQLTQVVLNVPKIGKKLRRTRQPTVEEMAIKTKILEIYELARQETAPAFSLHLEHLGRIIRALNPKYIATERVRRVAFADPRDPNALIPLPEFNPVQVDLALASGSPQDKLNSLATKFNELVSWNEDIVEELAGSPDASLEPSQIAFKQVILCLSGHPLCQQTTGEPQAESEPATPTVASVRGQEAAYQYQPQSQQELVEAPSSYQTIYTQAPQAYQQPLMEVAPQQVPYPQKPRVQIPEDVIQRFYMRQRAASNQMARPGPPMNLRPANHRGVRGGRG